VNVGECHDIKMTFWKSEEDKRNFKIDATIAITIIVVAVIVTLFSL
jgi:hypothetical protein